MDDHDFLGTLETTISLSSGDSAPVDSEYRERLEAEEAKRTILEEQARRHRNNAERWEMAKSEMGKLMGGSLLDSLEGAPELSDVGLEVEDEMFPAHRLVLAPAARSKYFRGLLLSGMQEGNRQHEVPLGGARAFRVVLRHLYTAEVPAWEEAEGKDVGCKASERGGNRPAGGEGQGTRDKGQGSYWHCAATVSPWRGASPILRSDVCGRACASIISK